MAKSIFCIGKNIRPFSEDKVYFEATDVEMFSLCYHNGKLVLVCYPCNAADVKGKVMTGTEFKNWRKQVIGDLAIC